MAGRTTRAACLTPQRIKPPGAHQRSPWLAHTSKTMSAMNTIGSSIAITRVVD
jgi:hypothetical protein